MKRAHTHSDILLIEDSAQDSYLIKECLANMGFSARALHFSNAENALDWIHRRGSFRDREPCSYPLLIMVDLRMPIVNGIQLLRQLRQHDKTVLLPVIMFSDSQSIESISECYQLGANAYIIKPIGHDEFQSTLKATLSFWMELNTSPYQNQISYL